MNMLENKNTQKRRAPHAVKIVLAAALAVGGVLSVAAGLPTQVYHFISGGSVTINPGTNTAYYDRLETAAPAEVDADGRLWLTADGQHLDITDKISEETPYIYERIDPATGQKGYLVLGGAPDNLGWMEWYQVDGDWFWHAENCLKDTSSFSVGTVGGADDAAIVVEVPDDITPEVGNPEPAPSGDGYLTESEYTAGGTEGYTINFRPWVEAANAQLAEMGVVECEPQVD